jgi:hypothetical protein
MKPRLGFGRRQDAAHRAQPQEAASDVAVDPNHDREDHPHSVEPTRAPNEVPIRPDLGPPAPGPQSARQPGSGLGLVVSIAISAIVFVLAIYATGSPTTDPLPLAQTTNALFWSVAAVAAVAAGVGALFADRSASRLEEGQNDGMPSVNVVWIVPVVSTIAAILLVATFHNTTMIVVGPLIAFLGNAGSLLSRDLLDDADESAQRTATTIQALVIHSVAFLALSAVYLNKLPTPLTALVAGGFSALLAVEAVDRFPGDSGRKLTLAILAGAAVAAAVTPLMWWPTHGWTGGAVLFVVFYCAVGTIQTTLERGDLRLRDAIEYALVPLGAFLALAITA